MPSFDVVCELDHHELCNAIDQANREITNRFDFKGTKSSFTKNELNIEMQTESDFQLQQMADILQTKLSKRGISLKHLQFDEPVIHHKSAAQKIELQEGISKDHAKNIIKIIKASKVKVQASIQGEQIRVTGKKRDDLQATIELLKEDESIDLPLKYINFRD